MADREFGFETLCLHAGHVPDAATGARAVPIYQTTSYVFDSADHAASLFNLQTFGNVYSRISNPTTAVFEERVAALEGGRASLAAASGMAAEMLALLTLLRHGDHLVAASTLYGGTYSQFAVTFEQFGIECTFVEPDEPENFAAAIKPNTRAIFAETIANPRLNVLDMQAVADIAHAHDLPLVIDNTMASPYLCRPFEHGADIVVHSATKYLGGHGTTMGGVVVESGKFPWDNGKFPQMTDPSKGYHGVRFYETFGDFGFTMKARMETMRTLGPTLSPMNAWLLLQGIETLPVRMDRHVENALAVATYLENDPRVAWVNYPGLASSRYHELANRYMPRGCGGILTFGVRAPGGGSDPAAQSNRQAAQKAGERFIEACTFMSHLANIGDARTLVIHPASTTHRQLSEAEQIAAGASPDLIRLSVGLESLDDLVWDLDRALNAATVA
ncbi:MAG: O-acetylhomoserine aminocarboxypropyltransferase/cysteine synthase family protein [Burkholderiaceae bacterium]